MARWLVRTMAVMGLVLATSGVASAQATGTIAGVVVDASSSQPLPGAQVNIPSLQRGMLSNKDGKFLLVNIPVGQQTVRVQIIGYGSAEKTVTVAAGRVATLDFRLKQEALSIGGMVVTALGVQRSQRKLAYAVQSISSKQLQQTPEINITDALEGRVAGVSVTSTSSRPGAAAQIRIRGEASFTGNGQPLWVIDGVPVSMNTDAQGGPFALAAGQAGSRAMDIDMNNVQSMSVLRGAAATALYGSRAAYGAIIITTKHGTAGQPTHFSISTQYQLQDPILQGKQTKYTAGMDGFYCNGLPAGYGGWCEPGYYAAGFSTPTTQGWGPNVDSVSQAVIQHEHGVPRMADPRKDFYRTGHLSETSLSATGGLPGGGSFDLNGTYATNKGITPNTSLGRVSLNANISLGLTDRLHSTTTVMYSNTNNVWLNEGYRSPERQIMFIPANLDLRKQWNSDGTPVMLGPNYPSFAWQAQNEFHGGTTGRWIASQYFTYKILSNLTLSNRIGLDTYLDIRTSNNAKRPWLTAQGKPSGSTRQDRYNRRDLNDDLILTLADTRLPAGLTISGLAGFNVVDREHSSLTASGSDIILPGLYNIDNFAQQYPSGDLTEKRRLMGIYSQVTLDYKDWAFLNVTGRNDWSSTLPKIHNSYFYPSASLGIVFTDALGLQSRWLDYGKLRFSLAKVGSDAPPYRLATTFYQPGYNSYDDQLHWPFDGTLGYLQSGQLGNPDLKPETTTEYEVGTDLRMFGGKSKLNVSYYDKRSFNQIFSVSSTPATGYNSITRNAGNLVNKGIEATLELVPYQSTKARWDVRMNYTRNRSMVTSLAPGVVSIYLAGYSWPNIQIRKGYPYGVIWGTGFTRNAKGQMVIGDNGWPLYDDTLKVLGVAQPDWEGNVFSSFNYGRFTLSALVRTSQGGQIINFDENYTIRTGNASITSKRGTSYVYPGVNVNTGLKNTKVIIRDQNYYIHQRGGYGLAENYVRSATATRIQQVSFQYRLPPRLLNLMGAGGTTSATLFVTGNNLKIWTSFPTGDPEGNNYGTTNIGGSWFHMFVAPPMKSYSFGIRANF